MKKNRKLVALGLVCAMMAGMAAGCGNSGDTSKTPENSSTPASSASSAAAEEEKQKLLAAAKAQAAREKDAMLREANEKLSALVSNAVDKLVSDTDDPHADFLHAVKRGA